MYSYKAHSLAEWTRTVLLVLVKPGQFAHMLHPVIKKKALVHSITTCHAVADHAENGLNSVSLCCPLLLRMVPVGFVGAEGTNRCFSGKSILWSIVYMWLICAGMHKGLRFYLSLSLYCHGFCSLHLCLCLFTASLNSAADVKLIGQCAATWHH